MSLPAARETTLPVERAAEQVAGAYARPGYRSVFDDAPDLLGAPVDAIPELELRCPVVPTSKA